MLCLSARSRQAALNSRLAVAQLLLEKGADAALKNVEGKTAAELAKSPEMQSVLQPAS